MIYYFKIIIGVIVDLFALIPSLLLVQIFRRLGSRKREIAPLREAIYKIKPSLNMFVEFPNEISVLIFCLFSPNDIDEKKNRVKSSFTFPWWCIFIAYGLCIILVGLSIIFIIARGIEFGDSKTQKWLTSILSGFFSSILLTQPLKVKAYSGVFSFELNVFCFVIGYRFGNILCLLLSKFG